MRKQIRDIAVRLPVIKQRCYSGTHEYAVDWNHERRLRKAYERDGVEGIKRYLDEVLSIQKAGYAKAIEQKDQQELGGVHVESGGGVLPSGDVPGL